MNDTALDSAIAIKLFIGSAAELPLSIEPELRYEWIADTLKRTKYLYLKKSEKGKLIANKLICRYWYNDYYK